MYPCVDDMVDPQAKRQRDSCGSRVLRRLASRRQLTRVVSVLVVVLGLYQALLGPYIGRFKFRRQLSPPALEVAQAATTAVDATGVNALLAVLQRRETRRHLIIHVQYGLGNRLRALASAMSVAAARHMPMLVVWARDAHCNCSFSELFDAPTAARFALLDAPTGPWEAELWAAVQADEASFEAHSYMREDGCGPSGADRAYLGTEDPAQHLFVRSAYLLNHGRGDWMYARWQLHSLRPRAELAAQLVATHQMVGLHVRSVVDTGAAYGTTPAAIQREWRSKGDWPQFVERMKREPPGTSFYLAADGQASYDGLLAAFPGRVAITARDCPSGQGAGCEARDAASVRTALVDMLNLARTRRILGSGYSSFSEAARFYGSTHSLLFDRGAPAGDSGWEWYHSLPDFETAGVDFGEGAHASLSNETRLQAKGHLLTA